MECLLWDCPPPSQVCSEHPAEGCLCGPVGPCQVRRLPALASRNSDAARKQSGYLSLPGMRQRHTLQTGCVCELAKMDPSGEWRRVVLRAEGNSEPTLKQEAGLRFCQTRQAEIDLSHSLSQEHTPPPTSSGSQ